MCVCIFCIKHMKTTSYIDIESALDTRFISLKYQIATTELYAYSIQKHDFSFFMILN